MPKKEDRIIIDTNLWISFLLTSDYSKLDLMLTVEPVILLFSQELIEEFIEVAQRPKFKKNFSLSDLQNLILRIRENAEFVQVKSLVTKSPDVKDNFLLALAKDGKASHLLTGDKVLLDLKRFNKTKIITISEYFKVQ